MYDTINIWIGKDLVANTDLLATIPYSLTSISNEGYNRKTEQSYISGNIANYKVTASSNGVSLKGSLAKLYLGDNLQILTRQDSQRAIELLADTLHLPIQKAKVTRLDIGYNFKTKYPVESYYPFLGDARYLKRLVQPKSIYYSNNIRQLVFYNKIAEAKSKGALIPSIYQDSNLLRYELRYLKRVDKQLNNNVLVKQIYNEEFYIKAVESWYSNYKKINKVHSLTLDNYTMNKPKDYFHYLMLLKLKEIGLNKALEEVEGLRAKGVFDRGEYYSRLKRDIKKHYLSANIISDSEHILELDKKVSRVVKNFR